MDWSNDLRFWLRLHVLKSVLFSMPSRNGGHDNDKGLRNDFDNKHYESCYHDSLFNRRLLSEQSRMEMARC